MFDKVADALISEGGLWGTMLVASWALFLTVLGVLWRVWRRAEQNLDDMQSAMYKEMLRVQGEKYDAAMTTLSSVNQTLLELKTLVLQMATK
jgi:hypothetical protein